jgi:hypothetical protein
MMPVISPSKEMASSLTALCIAMTFVYGAFPYAKPSNDELVHCRGIFGWLHKITGVPTQ